MALMSPFASSALRNILPPLGQIKITGKGIPMTQSFCLSSDDIHPDSPFNEPGEPAHPDPAQAQFGNRSGYVVGTPEHEALIDVLLRVFPDIESVLHPIPPNRPESHLQSPEPPIRTLKTKRNCANSRVYAHAYLC